MEKSNIKPIVTEDRVEMVDGREITYTRSNLSGQPIVINAVGNTPMSGILQELHEKNILDGKFDYAVAMRVSLLGGDAINEILEDITSWLKNKPEDTEEVKPGHVF